MLNFQGPLLKGKTSLAITADGNMSYDARTISGDDTGRRDQRSDSPSGRGRERQRAPRARARRRQHAARRVLAARQLLSAISASAISIWSNARSRPTRSPTRCARAIPRSTARSCSAKCASNSRRSENTQSSTSDSPTIRVLDQFTAGGAGQYGTREGRQFTVAQNFDLQRQEARAAVWRRDQRRLVGQHAAVERQRHVHVFEHGRLPVESSAHLHAACRRSERAATRSTTRAGTSRTTSASRRTSTSASACARKCKRTSTTRGILRRARRSPTRWARGRCAAATASSTTGSTPTSTSKPSASTARIRSTRRSSIRPIPDLGHGRRARCCRPAGFSSARI